MSKYPIIAVVTDHTDKRGNEILTQLFNKLYTNEKYRNILGKFWFVFTGGTFNRIFEGVDGKPSKLEDNVKTFLLDRTIRLPSFEDGGVTILSYFMVEKYCNVIWSFQTPNSPHHLVAQNNILRRNCDISKTNRLVNTGSIMYWLDSHALIDAEKCHGVLPLVNLPLKSGHIIKIKNNVRFGSIQEIDVRELNKPCDEREQFLAIIVRSGNVSKLNSFFREFAPFLSTFKKILVTESPLLDIDDKLYDKKIITCDPVGKGGLTQISMEVLFGRCDDIIIFDDNTIPDRDAYSNQVLLNACKRDQNVRVITNIAWARDWASFEQKKMYENNTQKTNSSRIFVENGTTVTETNSKSETELSTDLSLINDIVKFGSMGFKINSGKMKINHTYNFEYDNNVYQIKKDENNKLRMRLADDRI